MTVDQLESEQTTVEAPGSMADPDFWANHEGFTAGLNYVNTLASWLSPENADVIAELCFEAYEKPVDPAFIDGVSQGLNIFFNIELTEQLPFGDICCSDESDLRNLQI
jgi:hypothetical protein